MSHTSGIHIPHLSYSSMGKHGACPKRFYLEKLTPIKQKPSWASIGGRVAHSLTEMWDMLGNPFWSHQDWDGAARLLLETEVASAEEQYELPSREWRITGRASSAWPDKENREWWIHHLPIFGDAYAAWRAENTNFEIWEFDGKPAVEVELKAQLRGAEHCPPILGYVDRVFLDTNTGSLIVLDLKFGSRPVEDLSQLALYAAMIEHIHGHRPDFGAIYNGRKGTLAPIGRGDRDLMSLAHLPTSMIVRRIVDTWTLIQSGAFPPIPGAHCSWCDARDACAWMNGVDAWKFDPSHPNYTGASLITEQRTTEQKEYSAPFRGLSVGTVL